MDGRESKVENTDSDVTMKVDDDSVKTEIPSNGHDIVIKADPQDIANDVVSVKQSPSSISDTKTLLKSETKHPASGKKQGYIHVWLEKGYGFIHRFVDCHHGIPMHYHSMQCLYAETTGVTLFLCTATTVGWMKVT